MSDIIAKFTDAFKIEKPSDADLKIWSEVWSNFCHIG